MKKLRAIAKRISTLFSRDKHDAELAAELESHLQFHIEDNLRAGMSPKEARRQALIKLGGLDQTKESVRARHGFPWLDSLFQDIRFALRMLRKNPGFTTVAVLTLALGIGANTAIFSILNAVVLRTLPVKSPQQLVLFTWDASGPWPPNSGETGVDAKYSFSYPQFAEFRDGNSVLSDVFAFAPLGFDNENITVNRNGEATSANALMVTGKYFSGLGVTPLFGRAITGVDEQPGSPRVAVVSYAYWNSHLGRDPGIIGTEIALNGVPFTIVGVTPPGFFGETVGTRPDYWIPFDDAPNLRPWSTKPMDGDSFYTARGWLCITIMGRLKPGVSPQEAQLSLNVLYRHIITENWKPKRDRDIPAFSLTPAAGGTPYLRELISQPLLLLMGAVALVLLIACANVATLLFARASARNREIAVRLAMGASRARLIRQLLTESLMLSIAGGALGFLLADFGTRALLELPTRGEYAIVIDVGPDVRVLFFTMLAAVFTALLFGLAPAFRSSRMDLSTTMKESAADFLALRGKHRWGQSLVIAQISACLVLIIGAGLFLRSLINLTQNNFGFNQTNLLTFGLDPTRDGYTGGRLVTFYSQLLGRIQSLPGVQAATMIEFPPFSGVSSNSQISIPGRAHMPSNRTVRVQAIGPDFFRTMQIPMVLGRAIAPSDDASFPKVAVIDQTFANKFFPGEDPIGQHFAYGPNPKNQFEIIGVAKPAELTSVHPDTVPKAYFSYQQRPLNSMYFEIRSAGPSQPIISELRDAVRQSDPNLPLLSLETQSEIRNDALTGDHIITRFSILFGILALTLAIIGLYATIAYAVSRKTHEIGVRMALGAAPRDVLRMVIGQGLMLASVGILLGIFAALGVTRLMRALIFGVTPTDPITFVVLSSLLLIVALAACYIPARRAMRVDPMIALRHE